MVDASGRGSRTPDWLASLGFERPEGDGGECASRIRKPHLQAAARGTLGLEVSLRAGGTAGTDPRRGCLFHRRRTLDRHPGWNRRRLSAHRRGGLPRVHAQPGEPGAVRGCRRRTSRYRRSRAFARPRTAGGTTSGCGVGPRVCWSWAMPLHLQSGLRSGYDDGGAGGARARESLEAAAHAARHTSTDWRRDFSERWPGSTRARGCSPPARTSARRGSTAPGPACPAA